MLTLLPTVKEEELITFFEETREDYRQPKKVKYSLVELNLSDYLNQVELTEDDLKAIYEARQEEFKLPQKWHLRQIKISKQEAPNKLQEMMNLPQAADKKEPKQIEEEKKDLVLQIKGKFNSGQDFAALASTYSDDLETKDKGGDLGWLEQKQIPEVIRAKSTELASGEISEVINSKDAFYLVYAQEVEESRYRPYEEVRNTLEQEFRTTEAAPYLSYAAQEFKARAQEAISNGKSFAEFAATQGKAIRSSEYPVNAPEKHISPALDKAVKDLSAGAVEIVEDENKVFIAAVDSEEPSRIPTLDEVKPQVMAGFQEKKAKELAQSRAQEMLTKAKEKNTLSAFEELARGISREVKRSKGLSRESNKEAPFSEMEGVNELFNLTPQTPIADAPLWGGNAYYAIALVDAVPPKAEDFETNKKDLAVEEGSQSEHNTYKGLIENLKAHAQIWVEPSLLTR